MKVLTLTRFCYSQDMGTFGEITVADGIKLYTVEQPWNDNKRSVSCIPEGTYDCSPRPYYKGGYDAVEILGVAGRSHILFHRGNIAADVRGCVAVGADLGCVKGHWAVIHSRKAFALFMEYYGDEKFVLTIK